MPSTHFICPDGGKIAISECLKPKGCRMSQRCATLPYLHLIGFDREWKGVSPSSAGNGPRCIYLTATTDYTIDPQSRVWAAFGTVTHEKMSIHKYSENVLAEESLSDDKMKGTADVLEADEYKEGYHVLTDYKTWGSFKVAKAIGIKSESVDEPVLDEVTKIPLILKSGKNKGKVKTKKRSIVTISPKNVELVNEELQLNRYRIFFENAGFPISRMQIQTISRDGGTFVAQNRGVEKNLYMIPVKRLPDDEVMDFYKTLSGEVQQGFDTGFIRKCNNHESWERRKCEGYCDVVDACKAMSAKAGEKWGII